MHDNSEGAHLRTAHAILENALQKVAREDPETAGVLTLAVEAGASLRVVTEFPRDGSPTIAAMVVMPNGDARAFLRITAEPVKPH